MDLFLILLTQLPCLVGNITGKIPTIALTSKQGSVCRVHSENYLKASIPSVVVVSRSSFFTSSSITEIPTHIIIHHDAIHLLTAFKALSAGVSQAPRPVMTSFSAAWASTKANPSNSPTVTSKESSSTVHIYCPQACQFLVLAGKKGWLKGQPGRLG